MLSFFKFNSMKLKKPIAPLSKKEQGAITLMPKKKAKITVKKIKEDAILKKK